MGFEVGKQQLAYAKVGFLGFQGSGKSFTAKNVAIGLHHHCNELGSMKPDTPVFFMDTETGSDWMIQCFEAEDIPIMVDKTRAFKRLIPAVQEVEQAGGILIIDSLTHFWNELSESFSKKKRRKFGLTFPDWTELKLEWQKFQDLFVNSKCHIIICGRAGYEWNFFENDGGKKELEKTGVKMKAGGDMGYEPSLLVYMEHEQVLDKQDRVTEIINWGTVWKDRSNNINGKSFRYPKFSDFLPHFEAINIGGVHVGVDLSQDSTELVPDSDNQWFKDKEEKKVVLDEIQCHLVKLHPSTKADDKKAKADLLEKYFGTRSWARVETMALEDLKRNYLQMTKVGDVEALSKDAEGAF